MVKSIPTSRRANLASMPGQKKDRKPKRMNQLRQPWLNYQAILWSILRPPVSLLTLPNPWSRIPLD
jgi:hypothetical protein